MFKIHSEVAWRENGRLRVGVVLSVTTRGTDCQVEIETDEDDIITMNADHLAQLTEMHKEEFLKTRYGTDSMPQPELPAEVDEVETQPVEIAPPIVQQASAVAAKKSK